MKVALVHDWLVGMRGGEKCLAELCELYPEADVYTLVHEPGSVAASIEKRVAGTSFLQRLPRATRWYRYYLPLMPAAIEALELFEYDLVISSSHCVAKGVLTRPDAVHVSYVHTPMRYAWDQWPQYFPRRGLLGRFVLPFVLSRLRQWDAVSSARVDRFVANSSFVAERIRGTWGREAAVVHPPVDTEYFDACREAGERYLVVSALVPYKRIELAVDACLTTGRALDVVGDGPLAGRLRRRAEAGAPGQIRFLGRVEGAELRELYARCRALLHPGVEDFGISFVEVNACGRPAVGLARGGARDVIVPVNPPGAPQGAEWSVRAPTGVFMREQSVDGLIRALDILEEEDSQGAFDPAALRAHAQLFGRERYRRRMAEEVERALADARLGAGVAQGPAPLRRVDVSAPKESAEFATASAPDADPTSVDSADPNTSSTERARHASTQG